uniref:Uncharacterized protein n=1 Tax=Leptobrachium leishanense TaxID=445787 RepID=A0A8C5QLS2_9ANUR
MSAPRVGSPAWRDASYRTIALAYDLKRPFTSIDSRKWLGSAGSKSRDIQRECMTPPPFYRDLIAQSCNTVALSYMRDTRCSVFNLRKALLETNRHILRLQRERDTLERAHANVRRDIITNGETTQIRNLRPKSEKHPDKVDTLLRDEQRVLLEDKKHSENQLHEVSRQLKALYINRQKLSEFCKEKCTVLELVGETSKPLAPGHGKTMNSKHVWQDSTDCWDFIDQTQATRETFRNTQPPNWQKPVERRELKERITETLRKKAEESARIKEDVTITLGDTRNFIHKEKRLHDETEKSYQQQLGPVSSADVTVRESLTRPLVKILQRHPVTQLPESTLISQASASLERSLDRSRQRIGVAQCTFKKLKDDAESKLMGQRLDQAAARLRDRSAKNRAERLSL